MTFSDEQLLMPKVSPLEALIPLEERVRKFSSAKAKKVILLAGPTASGKSALSLHLAKMLGGEIISADSMQVYVGMDIGTAKVSEEDRALVPHHLIDIRTLRENFTVVDFYYEAKAAIESITARNRVPIVVGGTGFYFSALLYGPPSGPPSVLEVREQLEKHLEQKGSQALYQQLLLSDPDYAKTITHNDKHKIVRALEIMTLTGDKVSAQKWGRERVKAEFQFSPWFIYRPREKLYPMIETRCEQMVDGGFIEEVERLRGEGLLENLSARQAIGYRQCLEYIEGGKVDYEGFMREFKKVSRHLAKRQFTWFRREKIFRWLNIDIYDEEIAAEMIAQDYLGMR